MVFAPSYHSVEVGPSPRRPCHIAKMRWSRTPPHFRAIQAGDLLAAGLEGKVVDGCCFGAGQAIVGRPLASTVLHPMKRDAKMQAV